jgi:hypothetical protein
MEPPVSPIQEPARAGRSGELIAAKYRGYRGYRITIFAVHYRRASSLMLAQKTWPDVLKTLVQVDDIIPTPQTTVTTHASHV